jgi:hypothetical protein
VTMKRLLNWLIDRKWTAVSIIIAVVALAALWFTLTQFIEFSGLAFGIAKIGIGIAAIGLIDNVIFGNLNTISELREENVAFAITYGALILFVGLILAAV